MQKENVGSNLKSTLWNWKLSHSMNLKWKVGDPSQKNQRSVGGGQKTIWKRRELVLILSNILVYVLFNISLHVSSFTKTRKKHTNEEKLSPSALSFLEKKKKKKKKKREKKMVNFSMFCLVRSMSISMSLTKKKSTGSSLVLFATRIVHFCSDIFFSFFFTGIVHFFFNWLFSIIFQFRIFLHLFWIICAC